MDLKAKAQFSNSYTGSVVPGQILRGVPEHAAVHLLEHGLCEFYSQGSEAKHPLPLSSSPAAPASPSNSVSTSASDTSEAPVTPSPSTAPSSASRGATPSTPSTERGGKSTTRKRRTAAKK